MSYSISHLQVCSICVDEDNQINTAVEHPTIDRETLIKRKAKLLKCGHVFHYSCINKFFFGGGENCPNCRAPIEKEDRYFHITKDTYASGVPEGCERYISKDKVGCTTYYVPKDIQGDVLEHVEAVMERFKLQKSDDSDTISFRIDENGIAPMSPENT